MTFLLWLASLGSRRKSLLQVKERKISESESSMSAHLDAEPRVVSAIIWAILLFTVWVVGSILVYGRDVIIPIAIAVMLWQLINGIARLIGRLKLLGRKPGPSVCRLAAIATIFLFSWLVVDIVARNVAEVRTAAPSYEGNLRALFAQVEKLPWFDQMPSLRQLMDQVDVPAIIGNLSSTLGGLVGNAGLVALYVAFLLLEQNSFADKMKYLFRNDERRAQTLSALEELEFRIERYLWLKSAVSLLTAVLCYIVLIIVDVDYAVFWALIVFLLNFIPNIGSLFAVIFPSMLTVLQFGSISMGIGVLVALSAVQFVVGSFIEPRMMGNSLNLSPLVIILSLTIWGAIWGVAGMFLCVPMTVIVMIVLSHFESTRGIAIMLSADGKVGR